MGVGISPISQALKKISRMVKGFGRLDNHGDANTFYVTKSYVPNIGFLEA